MRGRDLFRHAIYSTNKITTRPIQTLGSLFQYYVGLQEPHIQLLESTYCLGPPMTLCSTLGVYLLHTTCSDPIFNSCSLLTMQDPQWPYIQLLESTYYVGPPLTLYSTLGVYLLRRTPIDRSMGPWFLSSDSDHLIRSVWLLLSVFFRQVLHWKEKGLIIIHVLHRVVGIPTCTE